MSEDLTFFQSPAVEFATNVFINVPIILQFEQTPLIEVAKSALSKYIPVVCIFGSDGTELAKFKHSQLYLTESGKKAGLKLDHPQGVTVCKLGSSTLFEARRTSAASLKLDAELFTPTGRFLRCNPVSQSLVSATPEGLDVMGRVFMQGNTFAGARIGILVKDDGGVAIGCS